MSQSLWNRAGSFDGQSVCNRKLLPVSIPLEQGGVFRRKTSGTDGRSKRVSIPLEQGGVFRPQSGQLSKRRYESQSLWNRAGSFDRKRMSFLLQLKSLNPFGTGRGLSTMKKLFVMKSVSCLNPFGTGRGLSTVNLGSLMGDGTCLNPFGTGRGLSTAGVVWCLDG